MREKLNGGGGTPARANTASTSDRPLGHIRVVCLTGLAPLFLGKWLADLGADVVRVEPPGGDGVRSLGPFRGNRLDADASLTWQNYAAGSRSVTANLQTEDGRGLFLALLERADVLVEASEPGELEQLGLGFDALLTRNPRLIQLSVSPFGRTGPAAGNVSSDLVNLAMSGYMHMTGQPEGAPIKPSAPYQSLMHAANHGLTATMIALREVRRTGAGVFVDVAARETGIWMLTHTYQHYDFAGVDLRRQGAARDMGTAARVRSVFSAKDGFVVWLFQTGPANAAALRSLVERVAEAGMAPPWLHEIDWATVDLRTAPLEERERYDRVFRAFFATQPKAELFEWALKHRVMLGPVQTLEDVMADPQLASRSAWSVLPSNERDEAELLVPTTPVAMSGARWAPRGPAPGVGEHTRVVFGDELGAEASGLALLHSTGSV